MIVLLKSVVIVDSSSKNHLKKRDVLIKNGKIEKIAASIPSENYKVIAIKNLHISQGWFDSSVSFGEPGFEDRETIENGLQTAMKSGFTSVAVNSNCFPVTDSKSQIQFLKSKALNSPVQLIPVGSLTLGSKGKDLAEIFDMYQEGATSFYDYKKPISNGNLLKIALQYSQSFNGLVQSFPLENAIALEGIVNEEVNSTLLGLKGIPSLAEELQIQRDLAILEYTGGRLHIPTISTKKSVNLIKQAKKKGLQVTCSTAISNLMLTDDVLESFDTNYKVMPPLRTKIDRNALRKGLLDGTIDGVTSDHNPINIEHKKIEFDNAMYGSIGLESSYGALQSIFSTEQCVTVLTNLKETFGVASPKITEGNNADITLFLPDTTWDFSKENIFSKSKNAALLGVPMIGKPVGTINKNKIALNLK